MRRSPFPILLAAVLAFAGCRDKAAGGRLVVFAPASLSAAMQRIAIDYERAHPEVAVHVHCAGTPHLLVQARQGAPVDVFAAADRASMERFAATTELLAPPAVLARNELAIVVPAGNPHGIRGLADLQRADLVVALCGPAVPAGAYARRSCERAGVVVRSRSDEPSVKALVAKVRLGELDAGVVYVTDLRGIEGVQAVRIPPEHNVPVELCIAPCAAAGLPAEARRFVTWALGADGRAALATSGFEVP